jgi:hypothetical protein
MSEEYDPMVTSIYLQELLQGRCTPEESCVVLRDVIAEMIVEYAKNDQKKLSGAVGEWTRQIMEVAIKKWIKKYPPAHLGTLVPPPPIAPV